MTLALHAPGSWTSRPPVTRVGDAVTELCQVQDDMVGPAPGGQARPLVSGTVERDGHLLLIADPDALAGEL